MRPPPLLSSACCPRPFRPLAARPRSRPSCYSDFLYQPRSPYSSFPHHSLRPDGIPSAGGRLLSSSPSHQPLPPALTVGSSRYAARTKFDKLPHLFIRAIQASNPSWNFAHGNDASLAVHDLQHVLAKAVRTIDPSRATVLKIFHVIHDQSKNGKQNRRREPNDI